MRHSIRLLVAVLLLAGVAQRPGPAQPTKGLVKDNLAQEELRTLRDSLITAINANDLDRLVPLLDDNVVATFLNTEVARGPAGVRAWIDRMTTGDNRLARSFRLDPKVDEPVPLYGSPPDTAFATGSSSDAFEMSDGRSLLLQTRWSAMLVKKDGKWKLAGFQVSAGPAENSTREQADQRTFLLVGGIAAGGGLLLGLLLPLVFRRRPNRAHYIGATGA